METPRTDKAFELANEKLTSGSGVDWLGFSIILKQEMMKLEIELQEMKGEVEYLKRV